MTRSPWFRVGSLALVFAVGLALGRLLLPSADLPGAGDDVGEVDRIAAPSASLTAPWYEPAGVRALSGSLVLLEHALDDRVESMRRSDPTLRVGVYLRELDGGSWIGIHEDEAFVPASLMKVAVLFHALGRAEADPDLLDRELVYPGPEGMQSESNTDGRPAAERMVPGASYTYRELLRRMISYSDNHAKDLVMSGVDPEEVDAFMTRIGFPTRVEDSRAITTPRSYGALFRILYNSSLFSRPTSEFALGLLRDATFDLGVRGALPDDVPIASKFGMHFDPRDLEAGVQLHECGIVYQESPWVLCVMTRSSLKSLDQLAAIVRDVTHLADEGRRGRLPTDESGMGAAMAAHAEAWIRAVVE